MAEEKNLLKPEQLKAINHDDGDILVSASAGSGKTFVMIKRIIRLVSENKAKVDEILAATFTEAAAADMKIKLKRALTEEIENGNRALAAELNKIATADICTLHAFCARLIRTYFFAAGVAPDFKVIDESDSAALKAESVEDTFRAFYTESDAGFLKLIERYRVKRKDDGVRRVITDIYDFCNSETEPQKILFAFKDNYTAAGAEKFEKYYAERLQNAAAKLYAELLGLKSDCERVGYTAGAKQAGEFYDMVSEIKSGGINACKNITSRALPQIIRQNPPDGYAYLKDGLKAAKAQIKALCEYSAGAAIDKDILPVLYESSETLARVVLRFAEIYAEKKRESNALDFSDLERFALKALKDESVKAAVRKKYKYVFVDEYQDVNGVQEEIISAVANGNLFMVGDEKQSIYGFRGCRSEIFENKEKTLNAQGGTTVRLNYNFRSAEKVIDFVNKVFDFCYIEKYTGRSYKAGARLSGGGIYPENATGRAELHLLKKEKSAKTESESPRLYNILDRITDGEEKEAAHIANLVSDIIDEELTKEYYDIKDKVFKRVRLSDVAVLTRTGDTAFVKGIVEGLNGHGIRVVSSVSQNVCDFPEIKTLINALKLIDCFLQDAPLCGTLLSVIGGFSEEDLTDIAIYYADAGGRGGFSDAFGYYIENADTPLKDRLSDFKTRFERLRYLADFKGAKGVLDIMIAESGYENYLLCENDGEEKLRRLYRFLSETVSGGKTRTVGEFLRRIETAPKAFETLFGGEEDAVNVMTIHSSKGLEFPVVIVCGLEKPFSRKDEIRPVLTDRDLGIFEKYYDDEMRTALSTGYREAVKLKSRETAVKEEMRLFYVALTRAQYSLHLIAEKSEDIRKKEFDFNFTENASFWDFIPADMPLTQHLPTGFGLSGVKRRGRQILVGKPDRVKAEKMVKDFAYSYPHLAATVLPLKNSVSAAIKAGRQDFYPVYSLFSTENGTDAERGTIAHRIMENYRFGGESFEIQIGTMIDGGVLSAEDAAKIDADRMKKVISSGVFDGLTDKTLYREQDFIVNIPANLILDTDCTEEVLLQGVIDLLAVSQSGAEIIDYKYSALNAESLKLKYRKQLELYAYAVEKSLGVKVIKKTLVNILTGETAQV
nr:UvrD-helicase domain-containing protein [Clostridia bacterium]